MRALVVTSDFFRSKNSRGILFLSKNPLHAKWRVRKTRLYRGSSKKWRGTGFFFLKTRCRRVRCTSRWQFCTCRIKRSVFIRRKLFQGMRQLFSRHGEGRGREKRRRILPRTAGKVSLAYHPSCRFLFASPSPSLPPCLGFLYVFPFLTLSFTNYPTGLIFLLATEEGYWHIFMECFLRDGVWKLLNARNARFNWYESRILYIFSWLFVKESSFKKTYRVFLLNVSTCTCACSITKVKFSFFG